VRWYWILAAALLTVAIALHRAGALRLDTRLHRSAWVVAGLVLLNGGWMAFDGGRALVVGDYVTPRSGRLAGELGPWSTLVEHAGLAPRSTAMKTVFLVYGLLYVAATAAFLLGVASARWVTVALAVLGLWYVPFGTVINLIVVFLLAHPAWRAADP